MDVTIEQFKSMNANPGGTLQLFNLYVKCIKLMFDLVFMKSVRPQYNPSDKEKKSMFLYMGGEDMRALFEHVGQVVDADTFDQAVDKIQNKIKKCINNVVQRNMLLSSFPQGNKSFEKWFREIGNSTNSVN